MTSVRELVNDLASEQTDLDQLVTDLPIARWDLMTAAEPWTIRDAISHLAFFDERQTQAIVDPEGFAAEVNQRLSGGYNEYMSIGLNHGRSLGPHGVLEWWRRVRASELAAFSGLEPGQQLPWFGPPIKARSAATARLMETWAHGHDVAEALSIVRPPTDRLFHVAELGVKTFSWSFANRSLDVPSKRVRVELWGPTGDKQVWNEGQEDSITGPLEDFCLVVVQRINYLDTELLVDGGTARQWMEIAQIFAGPPGPGRPARASD